MRSSSLVLLLSLVLPLPAAAQPDRSKVVECRQDADCGFAISICGECAPCQRRWRSTVNLDEIKRVQSMQARARCAARKCEECASASNWVGDRAICRARRCSPAQVAPGLPERGKELACKVDADCAIKPRTECGCPRCNQQVPEVVSRPHAERLQREHAKRKCPAVRCAPCATSWLPGQPACHAGRCLLVPPLRTSDP